MPSFEYYEVDEETGCHNWTHALNWCGYAHNFYGPVARQVWEKKHGELPRELVIDHLCRNPRCINLEHLEPVTHTENVRRGNAGKANAAITHCPRNHPYDEENTRVYGGRRHCRACERLRSQRRRGNGQAA